MKHTTYKYFTPKVSNDNSPFSHYFVQSANCWFDWEEVDKDRYEESQAMGWAIGWVEVYVKTPFEEWGNLKYDISINGVWPGTFLGFLEKLNSDLIECYSDPEETQDQFSSDIIEIDGKKYQRID